MRGPSDNEKPRDLHPSRECAGCGLVEQTGQCGATEAPKHLGYECGCLQAFANAMAQGWTWRGAAAWAKQRREGGR